MKTEAEILEFAEKLNRLGTRVESLNPRDVECEYTVAGMILSLSWVLGFEGATPKSAMMFGLIEALDEYLIASEKK